MHASPARQPARLSSQTPAPRPCSLSPPPPDQQHNAPPRTCPQAVCGQLQLPYQGQVLDFGAPFRRATMHDLVKDATGVDFESFGTDLEVSAWLSVECF